MQVTCGYIISSATGATMQGERNDCVVRAISNATGKDYSEVHAVLKKHGRKDRKGTQWHTSIAAMKELGMEGVAIGNGQSAKFMARQGKMERHEKGVTLGKLLKDLPRGRFVVYIRGHALAVVNGEIIDTGLNKVNSRVNVVWYNPETAFAI